MANKRTYSSDPHNIPGLPEEAFAITASDTTDYITGDNSGNGIDVLVTVTGDVTVTPASGNTDVVMVAVPAYFIIPFKVRKVKAATTATCVGMM